MESETPPTITSYSFANTNNAPIYVPDASVTAYKTATNWVLLASRIFPISDIEEVISLLDGKQDKLVAGDNITIDEKHECN